MEVDPTRRRRTTIKSGGQRGEREGIWYQGLRVCWVDELRSELRIITLHPTTWEETDNGILISPYNMSKVVWRVKMEKSGLVEVVDFSKINFRIDSLRPPITTLEHVTHSEMNNRIPYNYSKEGSGQSSIHDENFYSSVSRVHLARERRRREKEESGADHFLQSKENVESSHNAIEEQKQASKIKDEGLKAQQELQAKRNEETRAFRDELEHKKELLRKKHEKNRELRKRKRMERERKRTYGE